MFYTMMLRGRHWKQVETATESTGTFMEYHLELDGSERKLTETTSIIQNLGLVICCSTGCMCILTGAENWRTGAEETERSGCQ